MDHLAAIERVKHREEEMQPPSTWMEAQQSVSDETGLSVLLIEGPQPPQLAESNNNSICRAFQSSRTHADLCVPYCGEAFERAHAAGKASFYRCHAGLHCFTMPVEIGGERPLAVIGGRAFLSSADYRALMDRFRWGDLRDLLTPEVLHNVVFATQVGLEELAARLAAEAETLSATPTRPQAGGSVPSPMSGTEGGEAALVGDESRRRPPGATLHEACQSALAELSARHGIETAALIFRVEETFTILCERGDVTAIAARICERLNKGDLPLAKAKGPMREIASSPVTFKDAKADLFSLTTGGETRGLLAVVQPRLSPAAKTAVQEFCNEQSHLLEVLRLRDELGRRVAAAHHLRSFSEVLNAVAPEEAYSKILRHSVELMRSERGSLMLFDERANKLKVEAAIGPRAEVAQQMQVRLDEGVCGAVLSGGRPLVVQSLRASGRVPAPAERSYKSDSFISYPIVIGERKVGVINVTDKLGGDVYDDLDLNLLDMIAPQLALALDRAAWHQKATQFQLLSITDPLTGLVNRRYMEERLAEEVDRSKRHRFQMSFLMLDIDHFKMYNDRHGHQAGDLALEMTAQCLRSALRSEDVASRYGGEEFSVLLPQTNNEEAVVIADRIRGLIERTLFPHGGSQPHGAVTVSIGVSSYGPGVDTPPAIVRAADQALYAAKHRGRNCVEISNQPPPLPPAAHAD